MNDKERILTTILDQFYYTQTLCFHSPKENDFIKSGGDTYVHFGAYDDRKIKVGDLVMGKTGKVHDFKIGFVHEILSKFEMVIREIGSNKLCNYSNESFTRIVGLKPSDLYEKGQYGFYQKVLKAFTRGNEYSYRYGGLEFLGDNIAKIWIREAFGGFGECKSCPFSFKIEWNKRTTIKEILNLMIENGYGTKKFERE